MNFHETLSVRIQIEDIHEILLYVKGNNERKQLLYALICDQDDTVAYHALWIFCHFNRKEAEWLIVKQDELIDAVLQCTHPGKRRLLLNLLLKQPLADPPRTDFLDFCLSRMLSGEELPGVRCLCVKLAYELCRHIPELLRELRTMLEIMETDLLPVSIRTVRKNVRNAMKQG